METMFEHVTDSASLENLCARLSRVDWIGLDTEFVRESTYFPKLGLVQLTDHAGHVACIDPLAADPLAPLVELLWTPGITKVMHSGSQDLEILYMLRTDRVPDVFDTQAAAALLGHTDQESYAALVSKRLDISLEKAHTRADWLRRPLSDEQLLYAADDVRHLPALYDSLRDELEHRDRLQWSLDESAALSDPARFRVDPEQAWRAVKGARTLDATCLGRLRALAAWREQVAMRQDRPRKWILQDHSLVALARLSPDSLDALAAIPDLPAAVVRKHGPALLDVLHAPDDATSPPEEVVSRPLEPVEKKRVNEMLARARQRAESLGIAPAMLATRKDCEALVRGQGAGRLLQGWRRHVIGEDLLKISADA